MSNNFLDESTAYLTFYSEYEGFRYFRKVGVACLSTGVNGSPTQNFATFSKLSEHKFSQFLFRHIHIYIYIYIYI